MTYHTYILYSEKLSRFYIGFTSNLAKRLIHHNSSQDRFSKKGVPWTLIHAIECPDKASAMALEKKIKARGAKRFLEGLGM
jgi:putative endonuclease